MTPTHQVPGMRDEDEGIYNFRRFCKADGNPEGMFVRVPEVEQAQYVVYSLLVD